MEFQMVKVESSNIESIGFKDETMRVKFKGTKEKPGAIYEFERVSFGSFKKFKDSKSKGRHFAKYIRGAYKSHKILEVKKNVESLDKGQVE